MKKTRPSISTEHLKNMIRLSGYSFRKLAEVTGISYPMLRTVADGRNSMSADRLLLVADALGCSTDYLLGRCEPSDEELVTEMNRARKEAVDKSFAGEPVSRLHATSFHTLSPEHKAFPVVVWPYNLLQVMFSKPDAGDLDKELKIPISGDQMDGLIAAINSLESDEKDIVLSFYRDGITFKEIGQKYHYSREYAKQKELKAVQKLKFLSNRILVIYGLRGCERRHDGIVSAGVRPSDDTPISVIGLSMRAYNCLDRCGIYTLGELISLINTKGPSWWAGIRNMGDGTRKETEMLVEKLTGMTDADLFKKKAS